jgi:hypothetical protein
MKGKALTPAQQYVFLRHNPVCVGHGTLNATGLTWTYRVRPTPISREYEVCIALRANDVPRVFVISPDLTELAGGRDLPLPQSPSPLLVFARLGGVGRTHADRQDLRALDSDVALLFRRVVGIERLEGWR